MARAQARGGPAAFAALAARALDASAPDERRREAWVLLLSRFSVGRVSSLFGFMDRAMCPFVIGQLASMALSPRRAVGLEVKVDDIAAALHLLLDKHGALDAAGAIEVARVFARARFTKGVPWLARTLNRADSQEVRRAALEALLLVPAPAKGVIAKLLDGALAFAIDEAPHAVEGLEPPLGPLFVALFEVARGGPRSNARRETLLRYLERFQRRTEPRAADLAASLLDTSDDVVRVAALRTLGELGEARHLATVAPLTRGLFRAGELKRAAASAMEAIRARHLPNAERGALALVGEGGALALSEGPDTRR